MLHAVQRTSQCNSHARSSQASLSCQQHTFATSRAVAASDALAMVPLHHTCQTFVGKGRGTVPSGSTEWASSSRLLRSSAAAGTASRLLLSEQVTYMQHGQSKLGWSGCSSDCRQDEQRPRTRYRTQHKALQLDSGLAVLESNFVRVAAVWKPGNRDVSSPDATPGR